MMVALKQGGRARAKVWLGLTPSTGDELQELDSLEHRLLGNGESLAERLKHLKTVRAKIT